MKATKKIVFFGAMSSILLIGAANAETHVATKGYADRHVAGAEGPNARQTDSGKIIKMGWDGSKPTYEFAAETTLTAADTTVNINNNQIRGNYQGTAPIDITGNTVSVTKATDTSLGVVMGGDATEIGDGGEVNVLYDGTTITKNGSGQLVAVDTLPADGTATAITDTNKVNVKYDDSTITVNANNELQGNYQGTTNQISISGNTIGLDITTACPENTRCALTTNVAGQLVWEPLTTTDVADTSADPHTNAMYND